MAFDPKKFEAAATRLIQEPRPPRTIDVLLENQGIVRTMLEAGLDYRMIHTALTEAGWKVSYAATAKALGQFLILAHLPSSKRAGLKQQRQRVALTPPGRLPSTPESLRTPQPSGAAKASPAPVAMGESVLDKARSRLKEVQ